MNCAVSGEVPVEPVVSKKTGLLYEKRLIERHISVSSSLFFVSRFVSSKIDPYQLDIMHNSQILILNYPVCVLGQRHDW